MWVENVGLRFALPNLRTGAIVEVRGGMFMRLGEAMAPFTRFEEASVGATKALSETEYMPTINAASLIEVNGRPFVTTPAAGTMSIGKASAWLLEQMARIPNAISEAPNNMVAVKQYLQLLQMLSERAAIALREDPALHRTLLARYAVPTLDSLEAKYAGKLSNDKLYAQILQDLEQIEWYPFPETIGGGACFIAGTLVHTDQGLKRIEDIRIGDMVLSQPEQGGEQAYRRVINTFVRDDQPIRAIEYCRADEQSTVHYLYATDNHPFWVKGRGWVAAEKLRTGRFLMADAKDAILVHSRAVKPSPIDGSGWVISGFDEDSLSGFTVDFRNGANLVKCGLNPEKAGVPFNDCFDIDGQSEILDMRDPRFTTRVYNFEVEGFHSYYVGEVGVWVHNANCNPDAPEIVSAKPSIGLLIPKSGALPPDDTLVRRLGRAKRSPTYPGKYQYVLSQSSSARWHFLLYGQSVRPQV